MQGFIGDNVSPKYRRVFFLLASLTTIFGALYARSLTYGFFHNFVEVVGIMFSGAVFAITWHARRIIQNNYFLFIGIAIIFVGFLNLLHVLNYPGILTPHLLPSNESHLLSLVADYLLVLSFVLAPFLIGKKINVNHIFLSIFVVNLFVLLGVLEWKIFPNALGSYREFSDFKNISEYTIALLSLVGIFMLFQYREYFDKESLFYISASLFVGAVSSVVAGTFATPSGNGNFIAHLLKIFSFYFIYRTVVNMALKKPYRSLFLDWQQRGRDLKEERDRMQTLFDLANTFFVFIDRHEKVERINRKGLELLGYEEQEVIGKNWFDSFIPESMRPQLRNVYTSLMEGKLKDFEFYENSIRIKSGELREISWRNAIMKDEDGRILGVVSIGEDITEIKNRHRKMQMINDELKLTGLKN